MTRLLGPVAVILIQIVQVRLTWVRGKMEMAGLQIYFLSFHFSFLKNVSQCQFLISRTLLTIYWIWMRCQFYDLVRWRVFTCWNFWILMFFFFNLFCFAQSIYFFFLILNYQFGWDYLINYYYMKIFLLGVFILLWWLS